MLAVSIKTECLDKEILKDIGFNPLSAPEKVSYPTYCKKINAESKTCVNQKQLGALLNNFQKNRNKKESSSYGVLKGTIEGFIRKFNTMDKKLTEENKFKDEEITEAAKLALEEAKQFMPNKSDELSEQMEKAKTECLAAQNKASVGSICVMSSDIANDFVSVHHKSSASADHRVHNHYSSNIIATDGNSTQLRLLEEKKNYLLTVSAQESAANQIIEACYPIIKGACIYRQVGRVMDELKRTDVRDREGCYKEMLGCEKNIESCSPKVKILIIQKLFGPFDVNLVNVNKLDEVDDFLTDHYGTTWDKTKKTAGNAKDSTADFFSKAKNVITENFSKDDKEKESKEESEAENKEENKEQSEEKQQEEESQNETKAQVNTETKAEVQERLLASMPLVHYAYHRTNDSQAEASGNMDNDTYPSASYHINSNGRDMVLESTYSGVGIASSDILSVFIGILFISIQLIF